LAITSFPSQSALRKFIHSKHNECVKHKFPLQELEDQKLELVPTPNMMDPSHSPTQ
jgi:hypothetical protein